MPLFLVWRCLRVGEAVRQNVMVHRPAVEAGLALLDAGGDFADATIVYEGRWLGGRDCLSLQKTAKLMDAPSPFASCRSGLASANFEEIAASQKATTSPLFVAALDSLRVRPYFPAALALDGAEC